MQVIKYLFVPFVVLLLAGLFGCSSDTHIITYRKFDSPQFIVQGEKLAHGLAACGSCHGASDELDSPLSGGKVVRDKYGDLHVPNITSHVTGIGGWTPQEVIRATRSSIAPNEKLLSKDVHLGYGWMSDTDLFSIIAYLEHSQAVENEVERRSVGFATRYTTGLFEKHRRVVGYVPEVKRSDRRAYGKYLVDHVARCSNCHGNAGSEYVGDDYLRGNDSENSFTGPDLLGLDWSQDDFLKYLTDSNVSENCPTNFFAQGSPEDLNAIAYYLHSLS